MSKVYTTKGGIKIHDPKLFVFATTSKTGNKTDRYMIKGTSDAGTVKTSFIGKADIGKWGKATRMEAKPAKARKTCKDKFDECEAKKTTKRATKKKTAKKVAPKEEESEEESENLSLEEVNDEPLSSVTSTEEEEEEKPAPRKAKKSAAKGRGKK